MAEYKIIEETPISLAKLDVKLDIIEKENKELSLRGKKTKEYLKAFVKLDNKKTEELINKLKDLKILRLKDRHIIKIVDILPKDMDSLRTILSGETLTIKQEDLHKIVDVING